MKAAICINSIHGDAAQGLSKFVSGLAADWKGWDGQRIWNSESVEEELAITATSGLTGTVTLIFTLTEHDLGWTASTEVSIAAGEELQRFAAELAEVLG